MADANVASFPTAASGGIRAAIDAVITTKQNLEKAEIELGRARTNEIAKRIDAFLAASKTAVSPADALKARLDLEALRKTFDDQEGAIKFWQEEINARFTLLAQQSGPEVISALNEHIAVLKDRQAKEQGDVDQFALLITEFTAWRRSVEGYQKARPARSAAARQKGGGTAPSPVPARRARRSRTP